MFRILMALAVTLASWPAAAADIRSPSDKWLVNFGNSECVATRNYGTKAHPLWLVLKEPAHHSVVQMQWIRDATSTDAEEVSGKVQFDAEPEINLSMLLYEAPKTKLRVYQVNVPLDQFAAARAAQAMRWHGKWLNEQLRLTDMDAMMKAMDGCVEGLRKRWNVVDGDEGGASKAALSKPSTGNLASFITNDDYPMMALRKGQQGRVRFSLLIDEQGRIADCSVIEPSGVAVLDVMSCILMKSRARFTPATGKDGKPAKDSFIGTIRWVIAK